MAKKVADKVYVNADGEESRSSSPDAVALLFKFTNGSEIRVERDKLPENITAALVLHGAAQKIGDSYAGAESITDAVDKATAMHERLVAGDWTSGKTAGPRIQHLVDAIVAAKQAADQEVDPEAVAEKLKADENLRKNALNNPAIRAMYDKQKAERATAAARESAKAAKDAGAEGLDAF